MTTDYVDGRDEDAVAKALPGAALFYMESPTSWIFETHDIRALAALAKRHNVLTVIDNSWASPVFQRPITMGVDLVLHSASKYLGGHSDVVAGVVAGSNKLIGQIRSATLPYLGGKLSPFDAWLLLRGLRTLPIRMRAHEAAGLSIARRLATHDAVAKRPSSRPRQPAAGRPHRNLRPVLVRVQAGHRHSRLRRQAAPVQAGRQLGRS